MRKLDFKKPKFIEIVILIIVGILLGIWGGLYL
jgi:hypothetical protein